jgi:hypothetical protein
MSVMTGIGGTALLGNYPGYILTLHSLLPDGSVGQAAGPALHSDRYEARIKATLTGGLAGNKVTISMAGVTDDDHRAITARQADGTLALPVVRVYLFWRDSNSTAGAYLSNLLGLGSLTAGLGGLGAEALAGVQTGEYQVTQVTRQRGERRYETQLTGVHRVACTLRKRLPAAQSVTGLADAAQALADAAGLTCDVYPIEPDNPDLDPDAVPFTAARGARIGDALQRWGHAVELLTNRHGRGMLLIRDDALVLGPRPIPFDGDPPVLSWTTGLLSVEAAADLTADVEGASGAGDAGQGASGAGDDDEPGMTPARRDQWQITLRGRPDLQPGDVVLFDPPDAGGDVQPGLGSAILGAFAAPLTGISPEVPGTSGYVVSLTHELTRASGFLTVLTVVGLSSGEDGWDRRTVPVSAAEAKAARGPAGTSADPPSQLAALVEQAVDRRLRELELPEVGQVRAYRAQADGAGASAHRSRLWQGTSPADDGAARTATRLPVESAAPLEQAEIPYVTPFAWGKAGLVLPRYPGMRVASVARHGKQDDAIDVGALWDDGAGPDAEPGDWWLSLPAAVADGDRSSVADDATPEPYAGTVSNDLTDADGQRAIEVARLRIQVGPGGLADAGQRPAAADSDLFLSIEHTDGTTVIQVTKDGDVKITAAGKLELSGKGVQIDALGEDMTISAKKLAVSVSTEMTVE